MNELRSEFGVHISYDVALRGRNKAVQMIYGRYEESNLLPGYLHMLRRTNPGTITNLEVDSEGRFKYVFVALSATRAAFRACMRPVIVIDGTHLKGKNNGILYVVTTKDANEQLYPLAYGVGPAESTDSWTWFMTRLRRAYGCSPNTIIVSDQHPSIAHAISNVFSNASQGLCYFHLSQNLKNEGKIVVGLFQRAAYPYDGVVWSRRMDRINERSETAYNKLIDIGPKRWSRSQCPVRRYSFMIPNAAESLNSALLWARRLPITACLDVVRFVIEEWFDERRVKGQK